MLQRAKPGKHVILLQFQIWFARPSLNVKTCFVCSVLVTKRIICKGYKDFFCNNLRCTLKRFQCMFATLLLSSQLNVHFCYATLTLSRPKTSIYRGFIYLYTSAMNK